MPEDPQHLFVYGSLLSCAGDPAHAMLHPHAELVATGWIGGRLFDTGDYPALIPAAGAADRVYGELYALAPPRAAALLAQLDEYEQYFPENPRNSLFLRIEVEVTLPTGRSTPAWVYVYNRSVEGFPRIVSGNYASYLGGRVVRGTTP